MNKWGAEQLEMEKKYLEMEKQVLEGIGREMAELNERMLAVKVNHANQWLRVHDMKKAIAQQEDLIEIGDDAAFVVEDEGADIG